MLSIFDISLRSLNFIFLVIILGLTGSLIHGSDNGNHSRVNFALFAAVFGLVFDSVYGLLANFLSVLFLHYLFLIIIITNVTSLCFIIIIY